MYVHAIHCNKQQTPFGALWSHTLHICVMAIVAINTNDDANSLILPMHLNAFLVC